MNPNATVLTIERYRRHVVAEWTNRRTFQLHQFAGMTVSAEWAREAARLAGCRAEAVAEVLTECLGLSHHELRTIRNDTRQAGVAAAEERFAKVEALVEGSNA